MISCFLLQSFLDFFSSAGYWWWWTNPIRSDSSSISQNVELWVNQNDIILHKVVFTYHLIISFKSLISWKEKKVILQLFSIASFCCDVTWNLLRKLRTMLDFLGSSLTEKSIYHPIYKLQKKKEKKKKKKGM